MGQNQLSFIERCPLFRGSYFRGLTVCREAHHSCPPFIPDRWLVAQPYSRPHYLCGATLEKSGTFLTICLLATTQLPDQLPHSAFQEFQVTKGTPYNLITLKHSYKWPNLFQPQAIYNFQEERFSTYEVLECLRWKLRSIINVDIIILLRPSGVQHFTSLKEHLCNKYIGFCCPHFVQPNRHGVLWGYYVQHHVGTLFNYTISAASTSLPSSDSEPYNIGLATFKQHTVAKFWPYIIMLQCPDSKGECCLVWVLQQICWISLGKWHVWTLLAHVGLYRLIKSPSIYLASYMSVA